MGEMKEKESEEVWTGDISVETYCRYLEFVLSAECNPETEKEDKNITQDEDSDSETYSSTSSTETEDFSDPTKSDEIYMRHLCKDSEPISSDDETEVLKWYDTSQCGFLLPPDPIRCRQLTTLEDLALPKTG